MNIKNAIKRFIRVIKFNPEVNQLQHQLKYERIYKEEAISMLNELMDKSGYSLVNGEFKPNNFPKTPRHYNCGIGNLFINCESEIKEPELCIEEIKVVDFEKPLPLQNIIDDSKEVIVTMDNDIYLLEKDINYTLDTASIKIKSYEYQLENAPVLVNIGELIKVEYTSLRTECLKKDC